jgi:cytochrome P450
MYAAHYPPGPRGLPLLGSILEYRRDPLAFMGEVARTYGDVADVRFGPFHSILLSHPDDIKDMLVTNNRRFHQGPAHMFLARALGQGLLTSENPLHLQQRRLLQPAFHRQRIAAYADVMTTYTADLADEWHAGAQFDLAQEMMRLTLRIVGKALFDTDIRAASSLIGPASSVVNDYTSNRSTQVIGPLLDRLPLPASRRFYRAKAQLDRFVYQLIAERRTGEGDRGDLLSMLILARDDSGQPMADRQVRDEAMTLLLAGHETTANALTWTWYLLAQHPEVEAKLHAELDTVLAGRLPAFEDVPALRYTEMVFREALRLYPPAWGTSKLLIAPWQVRQYALPAGTVVAAISYLVHRDPRYWPEPERFHPERWTPEAEATRPRFAYFPFGGGPRQCIGEPFAWLEGILILATLAQRWQLRLVPGHPVVPEPLITLRPKYGMRMLAEPRTPGADAGAMAGATDRLNASSPAGVQPR